MAYGQFYYKHWFHYTYDIDNFSVKDGKVEVHGGDEEQEDGGEGGEVEDRPQHQHQPARGHPPHNIVHSQVTYCLYVGYIYYNCSRRNMTKFRLLYGLLPVLVGLDGWLVDRLV